MEDQGVIATNKLVVAFDDGKRVEIEVKPRDIARLEEVDPTFARDPQALVTPKRTFGLAWVALNRMKRTGAIGIDLPDSFDEFLDMADIEADEDETANPTDGVPITD